MTHYIAPSNALSSGDSVFFDSSLAHRTESPDAIVNDAQPVCRNPAPSNDVGTVLRHLTADEREAAIEQAERIQAKYEAKWEATGDWGCKGLADWARLMRDQLMAGRKS